MTAKLKSSSRKLFFIASFVFVLYFIIKCVHFYHSDYTSDIFCHLQLSRDWLLGKPIFYENAFGFHSKLHNYFFDLLMAPFTYAFNAYGLFIVLYGLVIYSLYSVLKMMSENSISIYSQIIFVVFYLSPLSYFVLEDQHYGFHAEMLLVPLSLLFTISFLRNKKIYLLWALLIILVKEDTILLLFCLFAISYLSGWVKNTITTKSFILKIITSGILSMLILIAGLLWLKFMNNNGGSRSGDIYETFKEQPLGDIISSFLYLVGQRAKLTLLILILIFFHSGWRFTLGVILFSIPVLMINFFSGVFYLMEGKIMIKNVFSLLWTPRLSSYWAYWISVLGVALTHKPIFIVHLQLKKIYAFVLILGVFLLESMFFNYCEITKFNLADNISSSYKPNQEFIKHPEFAEAAQIAKHLPAHYPVAPMPRVFGVFYKQDIVWFNFWWNAYYPARMFIASYNKDELPDMTKALKHPLFLNYKDRLLIYAEQEDTAYVSKAGIVGQWVQLTIDN